MAGLVILLIVGFAAVAVLLACLRGFSRELWRKKVSGVVIRIEEPKVRRPQGPGTPPIDFPQRKKVPSKDPAPHRVSGRTVALVGVAIVLGSRSVCCDVPAGSRDPEGATPGRQQIR